MKILKFYKKVLLKSKIKLVYSIFILHHGSCLVLVELLRTNQVHVPIRSLDITIPGSTGTGTTDGVEVSRKTSYCRRLWTEKYGSLDVIGQS